MSIVVDLAELEQALTRHPTAYLLLPGDGRPHVGEVEVSMRGDVVVLSTPGRTARRVVPQRPAVTLLLPPAEPGGYALVVDGEASLVGEELHVEPSHAVLHRRPRPGSPPSATGCGNDCQPLS
ncbi:hypothetical protein [uncultured Serinicoccus sp.]|uniref:hypothetical protein n=1 Tax=uncultured Serinicoccus sp. TaxID=735514 RepID=UPI00260C1BF8|nr:hypothetical protein [uncultured Serinicoccus sp.]